MAPSVFLEPAAPPTESQLRAALGRAGALWTQLYSTLSAEFAPLIEKWSYAGKAYGWSLQLKQAKRTVLYLIPCQGYFIAALAMGEKACQAAGESELPGAILHLIEKAPVYPEGRGVRLEVRSRKDLKSVRSLAAIKMAN